MAMTEKQKKTLLEGLTEGLSLRKACAAADIQAPSNVLFWCDQDPVFAEQYARARDIGWRILADDLLEVCDDARNDWMQDNHPDDPGWKANGDHIQRSRLRVDTRKWMLSKMLPKIYGERLDLHHSGSVSKADQLSVEELQAIVAKDTPQA